MMQIDIRKRTISFPFFVLVDPVGLVDTAPGGSISSGVSGSGAALDSPPLESFQPFSDLLLSS